MTKPPKPSRERPQTEARGKTADGANTRQCLVTRERYDKDRLIRFVVGPDGSAVPDIAGKLPGRGLWIKADRDLVAQAAAKGLFAKAAKAPVTAPEDLAGLVEHLLVRRCLELLGQAFGAGLVGVGSFAVGALLRDAEAEALFEAEDGAADGRRKMLGALKAGAINWGGLAQKNGGSRATLVVGCFSSAELGLALGRENVIHAALKEGGLSGRLLTDVRRLGGFRPLIPPSWTEFRGRSRPTGEGSVSDA